MIFYPHQTNDSAYLIFNVFTQDHFQHVRKVVVPALPRDFSTQITDDLTGIKLDKKNVTRTNKYVCMCTCMYMCISYSWEFQNSTLHLEDSMHLLSFYKLPVTLRVQTSQAQCAPLSTSLQKKGSVYPAKVIGGR